MASYYVNKYRSGWRIVEEHWKNGKRKHKTIPRISYEALGINPLWTAEEAKEKIRQINFVSKEARIRINAANRFNDLDLVENVLIPTSREAAFLSNLYRDSFGSESHKKRLKSHWRFVRILIVNLKLLPNEYFSNKEQIYKYFINLKCSPDYANKLLRILNLWGDFNLPNFRPVPPPKGIVKNQIADTYADSEDYRGESDPLTPEDLKKLKVREDYYNWLFISVWFGLRPSEIDRLKNPKNVKITQDSGVKILNVFQEKLSGIDRAKRWKLIPVLYPEQEIALGFVVSLNFRRPHSKVILPPKVTLYGGRKGFVDLMLDRGQSLEDISMWMGHQSIETTWKKYRNKRRVSWKAS